MTAAPCVAGASTTALWLDRLDPFDRRVPLDGDVDVDVAIVGGGFSGLWTAYYLSRLEPSLKVLVLEREFCGYGASGRNGGWIVGELAGSFEKYAARSSHAEALRQARAIAGAVDEVGTIATREGIDCGYAKGGTIYVARNTPQAERMRADVAHEHSLGFTEDEIRLLGADEARGHLNATNTQCGMFFAACASHDPAQLARGLAKAIERAGFTIVEDTKVKRISPGVVETDRGTVRASKVVQATEAYTRDLAGQRRDLLPVYSLMIATEPLPDSVFDEIGLAQRQTFADTRFMVIYGQRTDDNRLAFGGRGVPYLFGSAIRQSAELHEESHQLLSETLVEMLPVVGDCEITHRWGGVLGIPRDWIPGLRFDPTTGVGVLGGYVGEGVAAANLAGRTMADLVTGRNTDRTSLPWVGVKPRRWEPEPLRWLGVRSSRRILVGADNREFSRDKEAKLSYRISRILRGA